MRLKSKVRAGGKDLNHSQTVKGLRVRSSVKSGRIAFNHNQKVAR